MNKKEKFWEYILFDKEAFNVLLALSYIFGFLVCGAIMAVAIYFYMTILSVAFFVLTLLALRNIVLKRTLILTVIEHLIKKDAKSEYIKLTVADTINSNFADNEDDSGEEL